MGFTIKKTGSATKAKDEDKDEAAGKKSSFTKKKSNPFVKTGAAAKQAMNKAEAEAAVRKSKQGREWRFWLPAGEDAMVTFLNGEIDPDTGILDIPYVNEHRIKVNGRWEDVVCIDDEEPCPLCAAGESKSFIGLISVIDHREREYEKDGKTVKVGATRRILPAKSETLKQLSKIAEKHPEGLKFSTFEVTRTSDKKANVGDLFIHQQTDTEDDLQEAFGDTIQPVPISEAVNVYTAEEMNKLGIGKKVATFGSKKKSSDGTSADDVDDEKSPW